MRAERDALGRQLEQERRRAEAERTQGGRRSRSPRGGGARGGGARGGACAAGGAARGDAGGGGGVASGGGAGAAGGAGGAAAAGGAEHRAQAAAVGLQEGVQGAAAAAAAAAPEARGGGGGGGGAEGGEGADTQLAKVRRVERLFETESAKADRMRRLLGQKGRQIASLQRQIDDIPTRAELMQYERRFRELYQQLASKSEETKRYYDQYNLLGEKQGYLTKEASLINSIHDNFMKGDPPPPEACRRRTCRARRLLRLRCLPALLPPPCLLCLLSLPASPASPPPRRLPASPASYASSPRQAGGSASKEKLAESVDGMVRARVPNLDLPSLALPAACATWPVPCGLYGAMWPCGHVACAMWPRIPRVCCFPTQPAMWPCATWPARAVLRHSRLDTAHQVKTMQSNLDKVQGRPRRGHTRSAPPRPARPDPTRPALPARHPPQPLQEVLQQQYSKLVDKERKYSKLVKDFQLECERNEQVS